MADGLELPDLMQLVSPALDFVEAERIAHSKAPKNPDHIDILLTICRCKTVVDILLNFSNARTLGAASAMIEFSTFGRIAADMSSYQRAFCDGPPPPSDRVLLSVAAPRAQGDGGLDVSVAAGRALQPLGAGAWGRPCNAPPEGMRRAPAPVHPCPRAPKAMYA